MNTEKQYGMGKNVVNDECPDMALARLRELERLDRVAEMRVLLESEQHGHQFSQFTMRCALCGMPHVEYKFLFRDKRKPCVGAVRLKQEKVARSKRAFDRARGVFERTVVGRSFNE